jgi:SlyX protein
MSKSPPIRQSNAEATAVRLEAIESKLAFQEDALQQLHEALVAQQARLDQLQALLKLMMEQQRAGSAGPGGGVEPPPPHY